MQQLSKRNTYTPTVVPQDRCNCDLLLNNGRGVNVRSVASLKTFDNNPDAATTGSSSKREKSEDVIVYVLNHLGRPIMPCKPRKARLLLKAGKAKVVKKTPFTIQFTVPTTSYTQPITLGIDAGYTHVGLSAVTEDCKTELYAAEVSLRTDEVKLNSERVMYRRSRRGRKTWYRQPRFLNRRGNKKEGWLAPSIRHKLECHVKLAEKVRAILPISRVSVEVAPFDTQKLKDPNISGKGYQNGEQAGFNGNTREYVLYRDRHQCQNNGVAKDWHNKVLHVHHIVSRQVGGNRPDNLATLCTNCHAGHHGGTIKLELPKRLGGGGYKEATFISTIHRRFVEILRATGLTTEITYGYITKDARIAQGLEKSHINDAFVIAGGKKETTRTKNQFAGRQVRKCNRKLYKGVRSQTKNTANREVFGFRLWDKVLLDGKELFVKGRRSSGYFSLSDIAGQTSKELAGVSYKRLEFVDNGRALLWAKSKST